MAQKEGIPYCLIIIGGILVLAALISAVVWLGRSRIRPKQKQAIAV